MVEWRNFCQIFGNASITNLFQLLIFAVIFTTIMAGACYRKARILSSKFSHKTIMSSPTMVLPPVVQSRLQHYDNGRRVSQLSQCSRGLAIHIARPLKNGGALPIFHANPSYFDDSEIQSSDFQ